MKVPDDVYLPSPRKYIGDFDEIEYPLGFLSRKVGRYGTIKINSIKVSISYAFAGYNLGLRPSCEGDSYDVFLADFLLGTLDMETYCFFPLDALK